MYVYIVKSYHIYIYICMYAYIRRLKSHLATVRAGDAVDVDDFLHQGLEAGERGQYLCIGVRMCTCVCLNVCVCTCMWSTTKLIIKHPYTHIHSYIYISRAFPNGTCTPSSSPGHWPGANSSLSTAWSLAVGYFNYIYVCDNGSGGVSVDKYTQIT